jgi:methylmalonyl-CoA/ethylmalonyl-CoA epimerase
MIIGLDHIAIAVDSLEDGLQKFMTDLGLPFQGREDVEEAETSTAFLGTNHTSTTPMIELIHPLNGRGPLVQSLQKRGPGLHHLCFRTDDIESDMQMLREKGYQFLTEGPVPGAHDSLVAFIHPRSMGGVLVELAQFPQNAHG